MVDAVQKILDKAWQDFSDDVNRCTRWTIFWALLAVAAGILALWYNKWVSIAEIVFVPPLIEQIKQGSKMSGERSRLVESSGKLLERADNQVVIQEELRREELSERLGG